MARRSFPLGMLTLAGTGGLAAGLVAWRLLSHRGDAPLAVPYLDLQRLLGTWHEIARYPSRFEAGCVAPSVSAAPNPDGTLQLVYRCRRKALDGPPRAVRGRAKVLDPISNSALRVGLYGPFFLDLQVLDLGRDYECAVIGDRRRRHLWIFGRAAQLDSATLDEILDRLPRQGFDPGRLEWPPQPPAVAAGRLPAMGQAPREGGPSLH